MKAASLSRRCVDAEPFRLWPSENHPTQKTSTHVLGNSNSRFANRIEWLEPILPGVEQCP